MNKNHRSYIVQLSLLKHDIPFVFNFNCHLFFICFISVVYYGNKLQYIAVEVNLTLSVYTLGYLEGKPVRDKWEQLMQEEVGHYKRNTNMLRDFIKMRKEHVSGKAYTWQYLTHERTINNKDIYLANAKKPTKSKKKNM